MFADLEKRGNKLAGPYLMVPYLSRAHTSSRAVSKSSNIESQHRNRANRRLSFILNQWLSPFLHIFSGKNSFKSQVSNQQRLHRAKSLATPRPASNPLAPRAKNPARQKIENPYQHQSPLPASSISITSPPHVNYVQRGMDIR